MSREAVLVIGGSDSSGCAGVGVDSITLAALGVHAAVAVTAVTAQDSEGVSAIHPVPAFIVAEQIAAAIRACQPTVIKTGMLVSADIVEVVAAAVRAAGVQLVVDPVLSASSGAHLLDSAAQTSLLAELIPFATLVTPNLAEAAILAPNAAGPRDQAEELRRLGAEWVVVTGGHASGSPVDLLVGPTGYSELAGPRVVTSDDRGTGCTFASAAAGSMARGADVATAVRRAGELVRRGLSASYPLAGGRGTLDRFAGPRATWSQE